MPSRDSSELVEPTNDAMVNRLARAAEGAVVQAARSAPITLDVLVAATKVVT